jgi:hypothetical protein
MTTSFGYRVVRKDGELAIYEIFYDQDGQIASFVMTPLSPATQTIDDLRHELEEMVRALDTPILEYETMVKSV